jgi:phage FluMu protein Com
MPESSHCLNCGEPAEYAVPTDLRCECGFLLSKLSVDSIEIKCRRCKRIVFIPIGDLSERFEEKLKDFKEHGDTYRQKSGPENRGQFCTQCKQFKPNVVYGKCLECRTESIKVQYKGRSRN